MTSMQNANHNHNSSKDRALVFTVGIQTPVDRMLVESLIADIRQFKPVCLVPLVTRESASTGRRIVEQLQLAPDAYRMVTLENPHDLQGIFQQAKHAIRSLIESGFAPGRISINYSSGTKVMSAGLVLAAMSLRCESLRYIKHSETESERKSSFTSPRVVFAYHDLLEAVRYFEEQRYRSTMDKLDGIAREQLSESDARSYDELRLLTQAYEDWDGFCYAASLEHWRKQQGGGYLTAHFFPTRGQIANLESIAASVEQRQYNALIFADVYNNALRRCASARHDDAAARAYRVLEMLAQFILWDQYKVNTDAVDTRKVPAKHRSGFDALRSMDDGLVKIGLRKSFELLKLLEHPLGDAFCGHPQMQTMMDLRGQSFLSHGVSPLSQEEAERFLGFTADICRALIPDFEDICRQQQFVWIRTDTQCWSHDGAAIE